MLWATYFSEPLTIYVSNSVIRLMVKICWLTKIVFQVFCVFFQKLKSELALAYERYAGGILIVILIEILNDYCFILYQLATMSPLGWHPPHLMYNTYTPYLGTTIDNSVGFLDFFSILCPSVWLSVCVCTSVYNLKFLKTHNYWLARLHMWALFQGKN